MLRANGVPVFREVEAAIGVACRLADETPEALARSRPAGAGSHRLAGEADYFAARDLLGRPASLSPGAEGGQSR